MVTDLRRAETKEVNDFAREIIARLSHVRSPSTAVIRGVRREVSQQLAKQSARFIVGLALQLIRHSNRVPRFFVYELVKHHPLASRSLRAKSLEELGHGIDGWGAVDTFACYLAGPSWREGQVSDALIRRWAHSDDRWWRRAALVSTVPLNNKTRGGSGDTPRTLMICAVLVADCDVMVVKAMSWALRELSKRDPNSVRKFLRANEDTLAPLVVREVNNKLQTGLKNPRPELRRSRLNANTK